MRKVIYEENGMLHCSLIRDSDGDDMAPYGIPLEVPPIENILRESVVDLNNQLVQRGLFTMSDLERNDGALTGAILSAIRSKLINAYKIKEQRTNGN